MSVYSGFFNGVNHDRLYDAVDFSKVFDGLITDGVYIKFPSEAESTNRGFYVAATGSGRTVSVAQGRAWLKGTWTLNDGTISFTLDGTANELQSRIDAIVIDVNIGDDARVNDIKVIKGTEGTTPDRPTLINQPTHRQYPIAYITVPGGASTIVQSNIQYMVGTSELPAVKAIVDLDSDAIDEINGRIDQINENVPFKFGVDSNGKYGYYKVGADTVTPFRNPTGSAQAGDVRVGKTFSNANNDNITGTLQPPVGDAVEGNVLAGKTFTNARNSGLTGTMPNHTNDVIPIIPIMTNGDYDVTVNEGYYGNNQKIATYSIAVPQSTGAIGNATRADVLSGKTFSNSSANGLNGSMTNRQNWTHTRSITSNGTYSVTIPEGYHNGAGYSQVTVNIPSDYSSGYEAGRTQGRADKAASAITVWIYIYEVYGDAYVLANVKIFEGTTSGTLLASWTGQKIWMAGGEYNAKSLAASIYRSYNGISRRT